MLVRLVKVDKKEASTVTEKKFHRSRWWAYIWLKRFDNARSNKLTEYERIFAAISEPTKGCC